MTIYRSRKWAASTLIMAHARGQEQPEKWYAVIKIAGVPYHLGSFPSLPEAQSAFDAAAIERGRTKGGLRKCGRPSGLASTVARKEKVKKATDFRRTQTKLIPYAGAVRYTRSGS